MSVIELRDHGIVIKGGSSGNTKTYCPQCRNARKSKNKNDLPLSVTITNDGAVWNCHNCGWTGGMNNTSYKDFDSNLNRQVNYRKPDMPKTTNLNVETIAFLKARGISQETAEDLKLFYTEKSFGDGHEGCLAFPYIEDGQVVNIKYRSFEKQFRQEANAKRTLFNIDSVKGDEIIFVEGEMDVLALYEVGIKNAVSLPDGAGKEAKFDEEDKRFTAIGNCEKLQKIRKVIIATDMDEAGQALSAELAHRFGKDRCYRVQFPRIDDYQCKDANECLIEHSAVVLKECIQYAEPFPIDGLYGAKDYLNEIWDLYNGLQSRPFSTGFPQLDEIYKLMPSTFQVVTGIPNHGKSNFIDQIMINASKLHKWKFAIFSPEHSTTQHIKRLAEIYIKKPFDIGNNARINEDELQDAINWIQEHFIFIESKDRVPTIDWLLEKARGACIRHGINGVVIDPYNEIDASRKNGKREDEHIRDMISSCKHFCRTHNIIMWVVAHPAKLARQQDGTYPIPSMYEISGSAHWHNMADVGLVVHRLFDEGQVVICTKKIREQGTYGNIGEALFTYDVTTKNYLEVDQDSSYEANYQPKKKPYKVPYND